MGNQQPLAHAVGAGTAGGDRRQPARSDVPDVTTTQLPPNAADAAAASPRHEGAPAPRHAPLTLAVSLLAAAISFVNSWHVSMWVDEGYTVSVATRSLGDVWRMIANIDIVHSLFNVALHPWLAAFGVSDVSVRLPSAIAVGAATGGVMELARRLTTPRIALVAGLVFAILPRVTSAGIEGRSYAVTMALAVWMTVLFVTLLRRPTAGKHVAYAVLAAFAFSLNIFMVLLIGAHGVAALLERTVRFRRVFWTWLAAAVVGFAGGLPVLLTAVSQSAQIGPTRYGLAEYARAVVVNQWFLGETPTIYLSGGGSLGDGPGSQLWKYAAVVLAAGCWLLVAYAVLRPDPAHLARRPVPAYRPLLLSWLLLPTVVLVGYALALSPLYNPRYLSFCAPALALLIAIGLVKLRPTWLRPVAAALIVALIVPIYISQRGAYAKSGADWKFAAEFVAARRGPDQAVYFAPRTPPRTEVVGITGRTAQTLYPRAFAGLRDLTLVSTPAADADLFGRSQLLSASADRLEGMQAVFVLYRRDYPDAARQAETAVLTNAGFRAGESWTGPLNTVVEYTR